MDNNLKNHKNNNILFYIHDPMCSWCWAFNPAWKEIQKQLPSNIQVSYLLGGLASDSNELMSSAMQQQISGYWKLIQQRVPNTEFNFDFWKLNQARRSTYPACRAVIAARYQHAEKAMILAIQEAYYLHAKNPSDDSILIELAKNIGLNASEFSAQLNHETTKQQLLNEIKYSQQLGAQGFPSLILQYNKSNHFIPIDYNHADAVLKSIQHISTHAKLIS